MDILWIYDGYMMDIWKVSEHGQNLGDLSTSWMVSGGFMGIFGWNLSDLGIEVFHNPTLAKFSCCLYGELMGFHVATRILQMCFSRFRTPKVGDSGGFLDLCK